MWIECSAWPPSSRLGVWPGFCREQTALKTVDRGRMDSRLRTWSRSPLREPRRRAAKLGGLDQESRVQHMGEPTSQDRLLQLEREHAELKEAVKMLERRAYLTPNEQIEISTLKKQKLAAKDRIAALRREL